VKLVLDVAVPVLVFVAMAIVGLGLTPEDSRRVARQPRLAGAATVGQFVLWPLLALILLRTQATPLLAAALLQRRLAAPLPGPKSAG
jgi:predicted Na+-dependent transporter